MIGTPHFAVATTHNLGGQFESAIQAAQRALSLSPTFALGHLALGATLLHAGRPKPAIEPLEHGLRLSPYDPQNFTWMIFLALAYYFTGNPATGLEDARRALALRPNWSPALKVMVLCSLALGDEAQARSAASQLSRCTQAGGDLMGLIARHNPSWADHIDEALRRAG
jgi:adenylate cyclase